MITHIVKCDRCYRWQERNAPLAEDDEPIRQVSLKNGGSLDLCSQCLAAEVEILKQSRFFRDPQFSLSDPFALVDEE